MTILLSICVNRVCVICTQNQRNGATWSHLDQVCYRGHFWAHFCRFLGSVSGSKLVSKWIQNRIPSRTTFYLLWGVHFEVQKLLKLSQDGVQKQSQVAKLAKRSDLEKCCFVLFFTMFLEHPASQESPQTAKKLPKIVLGSLQEPLKKGITF